MRTTLEQKSGVSCGFDFLIYENNIHASPYRVVTQRHHMEQ